MMACRRSGLCAAATLCLALLLPCPGFAATPQVLKAAVVGNLLSFMVWPPDTVPPALTLEGDEEEALPVSMLTLCSLMDDPLMREAMDGLQGRFAGARRIDVRHLFSVGQLRRLYGQCQVLFVGDAGYGRLQQVFAITVDGGVLLIGETPGFAQIGGDINLLFDGPRIRIQANIESLGNKGLSLDARLLNLIEAVY